MKMSTKIYLKEVKKRCKRENSIANNRLHWFSSNFSIYFSYVFLKLRFSADFVTVLFFHLKTCNQKQNCHQAKGGIAKTKIQRQALFLVWSYF